MKAVVWTACVALAAVLAGCGTSLSEKDFQVPEARPVDPALLAMSDAEFETWDNAQRDQIAEKRDQIGHTYDAAEAVCWQRFAVNDCLATARHTRRRALEAVRTQELTANAAERARTTRSREESIQRKQAQ